MIWCLTRMVLYLICYKILHTLWFDVLQERFCICYKILHTLWFGVLQERFCIWSVIRYYIRYDLVSYKKGLKIQNWEWEAVHRRRTENIYNGRQKRTINNNGRKNTTQNTKRSSNTSPTKNRGRTQVLPGR